MGGLAGGAPPPACAALRGYGADLGLAFQICDDILDATASSVQLGKTAGKDAALAKSTFVSVLGVGDARAEAERLAARAVDRLRQAGVASPTLVELAHYVVTRANLMNASERGKRKSGCGTSGRGWRGGPPSTSV